MNPDPAPPRYRRRNRWPIAILAAVLVIGAIVVWAEVLKPAPPLATGCNSPKAADSTSTSAGGSAADTSAAGDGSAADTAATTTGTTGTGTTGTTTLVSTSLGTFTDPNTLASVRPADPSRVPLHVLNASGVAGQAGTVTSELRSAGFASIAKGQDDPLYPQWDLQCYGEIRYGYAGLGEARTVLLVAPCAQLVRDERADNSVDLALGKLYEPGPVSDKVRKELTRIANASKPPAVIEGQTVSVSAPPKIPPLPDRSGCPA